MWSRDMKCSRKILIYVEGETDKTFYQCLKQVIREDLFDGKFQSEVPAPVNLAGIGNVKKKLIGKFKAERKKDENKGKELNVVICYDRDVFLTGESQKKPPVNWEKLKEELIKEGAASVGLISAKECIEDWFAIDEMGIRKYLRLPQKCTYVKSKNGNVINNLYKKANKTYLKGGNASELIKSLDIRKIFEVIKEDVQPLLDVLR